MIRHPAIPAERLRLLLRYSGLSALERQQTLEAFDPRGNEQAFEQVSRYVPSARGLALHGPSGVGKSHLAAGLCLRLIDEDLPAVFLNVPRWLEHLRQHLHDDDGPDIWALTRADTTALLVLDDLGAERPTDWTPDRLYLLINERIRNCAPMACTMNYPPDGDDFRDRVSDRIASRIMRTCDVLEIRGRP